jgi:hypothetical protein
VENVSGHGTIGPRKCFEVPENVLSSQKIFPQKRNNCNNLDKSRNSEEKF